MNCNDRQFLGLDQATKMALSRRTFIKGSAGGIGLAALGSLMGTPAFAANPGLGLEYRIDVDWSATAGRFINSDNAHSSYVGAYYQPWRWGSVKLGVVGGAFNGYPKAFNGGWFPAVIPVATYESGHWGLNMALVPPLKDRLYGAVSFQLKFRFQD
jgi:hypothetical protein